MPRPRLLQHVRQRLVPQAQEAGQESQGGKGKKHFLLTFPFCFFCFSLSISLSLILSLSLSYLSVFLLTWLPLFCLALYHCLYLSFFISCPFSISFMLRLFASHVLYISFPIFFLSILVFLSRSLSFIFLSNIILFLSLFIFRRIYALLTVLKISKHIQYLHVN